MRRRHLPNIVQRQKHSDWRASRGGAITLEFILSLPVLFFATLAIFEFGILLLVQQAIVTAAVEGAREGAKVGATTNAIADRVQQIVGLHCIVFDTTTTTNTGGARVIIDGAPALAGERGNTTIDCTPNGRYRRRSRCG